jgi:hypothetical protein
MTKHLYNEPEGSDGYSGEVCRADTIIGSYRIIVCRDGIQWIIQRRILAAKSPQRSYWCGVRYFRTRKALESIWFALTEEQVPAHIQSLPAHVAQRGQANQ